MAPEHNAANVEKFLTGSGIGTWYYSTVNHILHVNDTAATLLGSNENAIPLSASNNIIPEALREMICSEAPEEKLSFRFISVKGTILLNGNYFADEKSYYGTLRTDSFENTMQYDGLFKTLIEQAPVATCLFTGKEFNIEIANDVMLKYWGRGNEVIKQPLIAALPELIGQTFPDILERVYTTGITHEETESPAILFVDGRLGTYYFDYSYKPLKNDDNEVYGILNMAIDVTERVLSRQKQAESEARFRNVVEQSPVAIGFLKGREMTVEIANENILKIWGKDDSVIGTRLKDALPEIEGQGFFEVLDNVFTTGEPYMGYETLVKLEHNTVLIDVYVDFTYTALRDAEGNINGVLILASDVSDRVTSIRELAASEEKFRSVIYSAQVAVAVFRGPDLVTDIANDEFLKFISRDRKSVIGYPLLQVMPELKGKQSIELMQEVYNKGSKTHHYGRQVDIERDGVLTQNFYNVSYSPLYDAQGNVYGVLDMAIDVTETIKTQEALMEAEAALRGAIELADLGTWSLDPVKEEVTYSVRMMEWFGYDGQPEVLDDSLSGIHESDRERVRQAIFKAIDANGDGYFNEEFTVINKITGIERVLHAQGKAFFDGDGVPYLMTGTAQDITITKQLLLALENEVKERTEALQKANYELEEINQKLVNTNKELEQYAYVASHDLQEPLRKISMFSNLLRERDIDNTHTVIIDKIVKASDRMSLLIKDLLEFSRLLNPDTRFINVDLMVIAKTISQDFELLIEEKEADLNINPLPVIEAVPLQMNQLFYNLTGNALKFVEKGKKPAITITAKKISSEETALYVKSPYPVQYYCISFQDNGIGIEHQYKKQVFEVFKRLHSRSEYSGSGIGLAICRRIVANHNGAIIIDSFPGEGTTFNILLPESQNFG